MALSSKQVAEIVAMYNGGENVNAIADAYRITAAAVRYQLNKAGVYRAEASEPEPETDADLGIGEEDATEASIADLLKNPALAALINKAVESRVAQLVAAPASAPLAGSDASALVKAVEHLLEVQSSQMPGYIKPISAEEVDRRATAHVEMLALLSDARSRGDAPHYVIGPSGLFDSTEVMLYSAGQEARTYLSPVEDFVPLNEIARRVHAAFIRSIGGQTPDIGAQVAEAMLAAKTKEVPLIGAPGASAQAARVEVVATPKRHDVGPQRVAGTLVPETRGTSMPVQPGIVQQPTGPAFIGA